MLATWGCTTFPKPTLSLDFLGATSLDSGITFSRASTATFFNSLGVLTTANNDVARFDFNPSTLQPLGLLIEEQRTNSIRNNTMQGAVAGTPGTLPTNWVESAIATGLTREVVGTGTSNGITYIDVKVSGTTSSTAGWSVFFDANTQIAASSGQVWTASVYVAIIGGSTANITAGFERVVERNSGGGYITESNTSWTGATSVLSNNRFAVTRTLGATAAFVQSGVYFTAASGVAIDITLRIGLPQLEQGAFATSVIPTTTTALTRNADVASMTGTNFSSWYNASEGTLLAQWVTAASDGANNRGIVAVDDGTNNNRVAQFLPLSAAPLSVAGRVASGGVATNPANSGSIALSSVAKSVLAYGVGTNQAALCVNGGTVTTASPAAAPVSLTVFRIGTIFGVNNIGGWVQRIAYYPVRLASSQLQALTS